MNVEKFYVYILQSKIDLSFYVGQTSDLSLRFQKHNEGANKYTSSKIPWDLVYSEEFDSRSSSVKREREIKSKKSRKYIEYLITTFKF